MAVQSPRMTLAEFDQAIAQPENAGRRFEYISGEMVEMVSNSLASLIAANLLFLIKAHLRDTGQTAYVTGADGGYEVAGERYLPDVGVISKARLPDLPRGTWIPLPPDLAVEVLSPTDRPRDVSVKIVNYLSAGTTVWLVDPDAALIKICLPGQRVRTVGADGILSGGEVLPGFRVGVEDVFRV